MNCIGEVAIWRIVTPASIGRTLSSSAGHRSPNLDRRLCVWRGAHATWLAGPGHTLREETPQILVTNTVGKVYRYRQVTNHRAGATVDDSNVSRIDMLMPTGIREHTDPSTDPHLPKTKSPYHFIFIRGSYVMKTLASTRPLHPDCLLASMRRRENLSSAARLASASSMRSKHCSSSGVTQE